MGAVPRALLLIWVLISAGFTASLAGTATIEFRGLMVVAVDSDEAVPTNTTAARVLLVNSEYDGNRNQHRMTHVPSLLVDESSIVGCPGIACHIPEPSHQIRVGAKTLYLWYIHDTLVANDSAGAAMSLVDFGTIRTPDDCDGGDHPKLEVLDDGLWDGMDGSERRIAARVPLLGGELTAIDEEKNVVGCGDFTTMRTAFSWTGAISELRLPRLDGRDGEPPIPLKDGARAWITNFPARAVGDRDTAHHFAEYYDFTDKNWKPWASRKVPRRARGGAEPIESDLIGAHDTFCPPTTLRKKGG